LGDFPANHRADESYERVLFPAGVGDHKWHLEQPDRWESWVLYPQNMPRKKERKLRLSEKLFEVASGK